MEARRPQCGTPADAQQQPPQQQQLEQIRRIAFSAFAEGVEGDSHRLRYACDRVPGVAAAVAVALMSTPVGPAAAARPSSHREATSRDRRPMSERIK